MSNQSGTIGKYQIIREIARSNDIVYEAYDPLMNRRVALKELMMPPGATPQQREERIKRFLREARAAGTLSHPNIMTVYEAGEADGRHFIAMEYLDGCTLRNEIDTKGFLPVERAVEIADKILNALDYAHKNGVIHRDIKPENIQLLVDGRIKLTDFGIARLTFEPNLTMDGQVFGTPSYMSPEQVVGKDIDARSDLFSMGSVIYEMISGQKPFTGDSVVSITYAIMNKEPDRPAQANFAVWQFLQRALEKSPQLRYTSASDMQQALHDAQHAVQPGSPVIGPMGTTVPPPTIPQTNPYLPPQPMYNYTAPPQYQTPAPQPIAPNQPLTTPYNPYQASQAQPQQQQPPSLFASNVYQPQYTPGGVQPPVNVPIYYPPPPRVPLMKPETRVFLGRLFVTLMVMGTLVALIIVGINALSIAASRESQRQHDNSIVMSINAVSDSLPVEDQIAKRKALIEQLTSDVSRSEENRKLAVLYQRLGDGQSSRKDWVSAESSYWEATKLDPERAEYYSSLGKLFEDRVSTATETDDQINFLRRASDMWLEAYRCETGDKKKQHDYALYASNTTYSYAKMLDKSGNSSDALDALKKLDGITPSDSEAYPLIRELKSKLTRFVDTQP